MREVSRKQVGWSSPPARQEATNRNAGWCRTTATTGWDTTGNTGRTSPLGAVGSRFRSGPHRPRNVAR
ncbi:hypothetical protein GCM10023214_08310 [Amycolatopsis dongchuanensis]|uniref:Uncharacterized protein n=1 Tax=Amycolatopsis dongchuanensis TaxID=1070866 RepID=A0ABP9PY65_9PSEU